MELLARPQLCMLCPPPAAALCLLLPHFQACRNAPVAAALSLHLADAAPDANQIAFRQALAGARRGVQVLPHDRLILEALRGARHSSQAEIQTQGNAGSTQLQKDSLDSGSASDTHQISGAMTRGFVPASATNSKEAAVHATSRLAIGGASDQSCSAADVTQSALAEPMMQLGALELLQLLLEEVTAVVSVQGNDHGVWECRTYHIKLSLLSVVEIMQGCF